MQDYFLIKSVSYCIVIDIYLYKHIEMYTIYIVCLIALFISILDK